MNVMGARLAKGIAADQRARDDMTAQHTQKARWRRAQCALNPMGTMEQHRDLRARHEH